MRQLDILIGAIFQADVHVELGFALQVSVTTERVHTDMSGNGDWCGLGQRGVGESGRNIAAFLCAFP